VQEAGVVAYLALMLSVPLVIAAFALLRPARRAVLVSVLATTLFLPELVAFDAPLIPPLDKGSLPTLCLLIGVVLTSRGRIKQVWSRDRGFLLLLALGPVAMVGTVLTNRDPIIFEASSLPGLAPGDVVSEVIRALLGSVGAFFLGRTVFQDTEDAKDLLRAIVIGALLYVPFVLIELRLTPQLHYWIYGYHQHNYLQARREGGFRPMVFVANGLALAMYLCSAVLAAWMLVRARCSVLTLPAFPFALMFSVLLLVIHSLGVVVYCLVLVPLIWLVGPRTQLLVASVLAICVAIFPISRAQGWFPTDYLVDLSAQVSQDRAQSLDFRFKNEDMLLEKALERPLFGWGGFARNRVYNEQGKDISVTDGDWIITLGIKGILGFIARYGLLIAPILIAFKRISSIPRSEQALLAGPTLILTAYAVDLLPNGMGNELPMFLSGAVAGLSYGMSQRKERRLPPWLVQWLRIAYRMRGATSAQPR
jgi:hypothetical protein